MTTEPSTAVEPTGPPKPTDESSPTSVIPPQPTVPSPASPPVVIEDQPPHNASPVLPQPAKTEEGSEDAAKSHADAESTSASSTALVPSGGGSINRDVALAKVNQERTYSHIRAWEDNEKAKSTNKFNRIIAKINAWENTKKATAEAKLRKAEEKLEKKRAAYVETMKNEIAALHREAEEKRAVAEAKRGEEHVQAEERSARYKATGQIPKRYLCWGG